MMHVFVSYSKRDTRGLALRITNTLAQLPNVTTWMDQSLESGESWALQIQQEIDRCDFMVVLLSPDVNRPVTESQSRSFVLNEIDYAQQERKRIIPVLAQRTRMPVQLAGIQYIDFTQSYDAAIQKLVERIARELPQGATHELTAPIQVRRNKRSNLVFALATAAVLLTIAGALLLSNRMSDTAQQLTIEALMLSTTEQTTSSPTYSASANTEVLLASATQTPSPQPSNTLTPTHTLTANELASTPIAHNSDWTPVVETFEGISMVLVPAGCFTLGSSDGSNFEKPPVRKCFSQPYWIGQTEVTNQQYGSEGYWGYRGDERPRDSVTWKQAQNFCEIKGGRLPTETEWEYAARGPDDLKFPWGTIFEDSRVIYAANADQSVIVGTKPNGASWVGALDMSGNLMEWTASLYQPFDDSVNDRVDNLTDTTSFRTLRGGSWVSGVTSLPLWRRASEYADYSGWDAGFRCWRPA